MDSACSDIPAQTPILIAGPTASGKSEIAMQIAEKQGGLIINADALQVFADWRVLTARPSAEDEASFEHALYGHVAGDTEYSVGAWLADIKPLLFGKTRPIIVGGTGLYFSALTEGLADIPKTPPEIRTEANQIFAENGLSQLIGMLDQKSRQRVDLKNPMRVIRAWEVLKTTGRGLADWQDNTPAPLLPLNETHPILVDAEKEWLNRRIRQRFDRMLEQGAVDEARKNQPGWRDDLPSAKAIGARELMSYLEGNQTLEQVSDSVTVATSQYAKRQRNWFRARMSAWGRVARP